MEGGLGRPLEEFANAGSIAQGIGGGDRSWAEGRMPGGPASGEASHVGGNRRFGAARGGRITSYNVCYTKLLRPASLRKFLAEQIKTLGTSACPPYHLAIVIGGTSAELTMKTVKMASTHYYDALV